VETKSAFVEDESAADKMKEMALAVTKEEQRMKAEEAKAKAAAAEKVAEEEAKVAAEEAKMKAEEAKVKAAVEAPKAAQGSETKAQQQPNKKGGQEGGGPTKLYKWLHRMRASKHTPDGAAKTGASGGQEKQGRRAAPPPLQQLHQQVPQSAAGMVGSGERGRRYTFNEGVGMMQGQRDDDGERAEARAAKSASRQLDILVWLARESIMSFAPKQVRVCAAAAAAAAAAALPPLPPSFPKLQNNNDAVVFFLCNSTGFAQASSMYFTCCRGGH
jgi:hypothetical protein